MKYQLRFHLSNGPHKNHWQVTHPDRSVTYHDPNHVQITMTGAIFKNNATGAQKIFEGGDKRVTTKIHATSLEVKENINSIPESMKQITFNPRIAPNWMHDGEIADGKEALHVLTHGRQVFI